jgi:transmembrane sensor
MQNESGLPSNSESAADWDAIARYIAGESEPDEARIVTAWLAAHPGDAALVEAVHRRAGLAEARAAIAVDTEAALARVRARMADDGGAVAPPRLQVERGGLAAETVTGRPAPARVTAPPTRAPRRGWMVASLAAAAALALFVVRQRGAEDSAAERVYATQVGARDSINLADGSYVILAPGSTLTVAAGFGATSREITLDGEAFFEVKHDGAHPFTVHTRNADIRDIGTAFSIKTDATGGVAVAVTHGVVALTETASGELRAGDRGVVRGERVDVSRGIVTEDDVAWTHGKLSYRDTPLSEVQSDLRRWYGIELKLEGAELAQRTLTASLPSDSAATVINAIALMLGAEAVQRGDTVTLQMTGRSSTP